MSTIGVPWIPIGPSRKGQSIEEDPTALDTIVPLGSHIWVGDRAQIFASLCLDLPHYVGVMNHLEPPKRMQVPVLPVEPSAPVGERRGIFMSPGSNFLLWCANVSQEGQIRRKRRLRLRKGEDIL